jgi:hypothetical protein
MRFANHLRQMIAARFGAAFSDYTHSRQKTFIFSRRISKEIILNGRIVALVCCHNILSNRLDFNAQQQFGQTLTTYRPEPGSSSLGWRSGSSEHLQLNNKFLIRMHSSRNKIWVLIVL